MNSRYSQQKRILIVDDEEIVRLMTVRLIEAMGYAVESAATAAEAERLLVNRLNRGDSFDLVILDLTLPGGPGGQEILERLKHMDANIRAIVTSGYRDSPIMEDSRRYGFAGALTKPFDRETLTVLLERIFSADKEPRKDSR